MRFIVYISCLLFIASCTSKKGDTIDVTDIMPKSKRNYDHKPDTVDTIENFNGPMSLFNQYGIEVVSMESIDKKEFPDRVGPKSAFKYKLGMSGDTLDYYIWQFKDSSRVMNAFYNWMDMLGVDQIGSSQRIQKQALNMFIGDSTLVYISGNAINIQNWEKYFEGIGYDPNWNYIIDQKRGRKAKWYIFADEEKIEFKIEEE